MMLSPSMDTDQTPNAIFLGGPFQNNNMNLSTILHKFTMEIHTFSLATQVNPDGKRTLQKIKGEAR